MPKDTGIRVYCRVRPLEKDEKKGIVHVSNDHAVKVDKADGKHEAIDFTKVFGPEKSLDQIYSAHFALVGAAVLEGRSSALMVYGGANSGRHDTLWGVPSNHGVFPRLLDDLFKAVDESKTEKVHVKFSVLEVHSNKLRDLIYRFDHHGKKESTDPVLEIKQHEENGKTATYVVGAVEVDAKSSADIITRVHKVEHERSVHHTKHEISNRGHMIVAIHVSHGDNHKTQGRQHATLFAVDLAPLATIQPLSPHQHKKKDNVEEEKKEVASIAHDLHAIHYVMEKVAHRHEHHKKDTIHFKDAAITYLLHDAFHDQSVAELIVCVSPHEPDRDATIHALEWSGHVRVRRNPNSPNSPSSPTPMSPSSPPS